MDAKKFEKIYQENGSATDPGPFASREEWNQAIDYCTARNQGQSPTQAAATVAANAAKFSGRPRKRPETETDRLYRELQDSCNRTALGGPHSR